MRWQRLLFIGVVLAAAIIGANWRLKDIVHPKAESIRKSIRYDEVTGKINILVVGEDDTGDSHRADSIAIATLDIEGKKVKLLSLPRDTRIDIPGRGWNKLGHAYSYGGIDLLKRTLVNYLGLPIHYYVVVGYDSFPKLVDLLGGVEIEVETRMRYVDKAGGLYIDIPPGRHLMNGDMALKYVRFRHDAMGDLGRIQRQHKFIAALLKRMTDPQILPHLGELTKEMASIVKTDLSPSQALQLGLYFKDLSLDNINVSTLPGKPAFISGVSYWLGDISQISAFLSGEMPSEAKMPPIGQEGAGGATNALTSMPEEDQALSKERVESIKGPIAVLNGDGSEGLSAKVARELHRLGIEVAYRGNARHFDYHYSNIIYPSKGAESQKEAQILAELLRIPKDLVRPSEAAAHVTIIVGHDHETLLSRLRNLKVAP